MRNGKMTVHEVAALTGITIRTLHYYDEIGLLKPATVTGSNYRLYTDDDLSRLQEILFFREVGFALKEIKELIHSPNYDRNAALKRHLAILQAQKERINALILLVEKKIEGTSEISFGPFSNTRIMELQETFRSEVLERWGHTASFKEYEAAFASQTRNAQAEQMEGLYAAAQSIFEKLALYEDASPGCQEVQQIVKEWQDYISAHFYTCDLQMLSCLGQLYVTDARFSKYINRFGNRDLAAFLSKAIEVFCAEESRKT